MVMQPLDVVKTRIHLQVGVGKTLGLNLQHLGLRAHTVGGRNPAPSWMVKTCWIPINNGILPTYQLVQDFFHALHGKDFRGSEALVRGSATPVASSEWFRSQNEHLQMKKTTHVGLFRMIFLSRKLEIWTSVCLISQVILRSLGRKRNHPNGLNGH